MSALSVYANSIFKRAKGDRFWEIDSLRGVAIIMMVIYHLMWDLVSLRIIEPVAYQEGFWYYFQRTTASFFITLVGVSLTVSYRRASKRQGSSAGLFPKFLKRGIFIFGLGVAASIVVSVSRFGVIHFGILHLIGFSIIAAYPFLPYRWLNFVLWIVFLILGYAGDQVSATSHLFVWAGILPPIYLAVDYIPIFPWFGVVLLGLFLGNSLYTADHRRFPLPDLSDWLLIRALQFLGRHSLIIYLIHQPILIAILILLGLASL